MDSARIDGGSQAFNVGLRGIPGPFGVLCRTTDVRKELRMGEETWKMLLAAGLDKKLVDLGSDCLYVFTNDLHEFARSRPQIPERQSVVRRRERKEPKK